MHQRGRWMPPGGMLCAVHQEELAAQARKAEHAKQLGECGLPGRLSGYRWDTVSEYTDAVGAPVAYRARSGITHAAFKRYQDSLGDDTIGITPWNKSLALTLRGLCSPDASVKSYLIMGPVGSGKSTLMAATVSGLLERGLACRYITEADLWAVIRRQWGGAGRKHHRGPDVIQELIDVAVLALDDLGTIDNPRPWHIDGMERLICGRYAAGRPTLITTNYSLDQIAGGQGEDGEWVGGYGERVASRLTEMIGRGARYVRLGGPDWRTGMIRVDVEPDAPQVCDGCQQVECRCACSECGYHPCRDLASCR